MIYSFKVTLEGIKGFHRLYKVSGNHTLYTFHKQIRSDLEFSVDQPILFKAYDANGTVSARYALVDLGSGTVDEVRIETAVRSGSVRFIYFYDIPGKKSVTITLEGSEEGADTLPVLIDAKGPVPAEFENGYVAFEDLPVEHKHLPGEHHHHEGDEEDDDDDDDEGEDGSSDDDEEEIIYDADE